MEQLLRLGVALPVGGFCCMVNGVVMLAASFWTGPAVWPDDGGAGGGGGGPALWLSVAQDGGPGGGMAAAETWLYPAGGWCSSN